MEKTANSKQLYLRCLICKEYFEYYGHKRKMFCSTKCKQKYYKKVKKV